MKRKLIVRPELRKRAERILASDLVEIPVPGHPFPSPLVPLPPSVRENLLNGTWRMSAEEIKGMRLVNLENTYDIPANVELAPIRCVVEPPCNVCHYCKTHDRGADWWVVTS